MFRCDVCDEFSDEDLDCLYEHLKVEHLELFFEECFVVWADEYIRED